MKNTHKDLNLPVSILTKSQRKVITKQIDYDAKKCDLIVTIRHDDQCGNGHNSFAITGDIYKHNRRDDASHYTGGCIHEEIEKHYPELVYLIKWHLCSTDEPMHYLSNTLYHASTKDHNGKEKGEATHYSTTIKFGDFPIVFGGYRSLDKKFIEWLDSLENYDLNIASVEHDNKDGYNFSPKYTFLPYSLDKWHTCPFATILEAEQFLEALQNYKMRVVKTATSFSDGKEADLEAAQNSAIWHDAKIEDFTKENLLKRLPKLMNDFKHDVESLGFTY